MGIFFTKGSVLSSRFIWGQFFLLLTISLVIFLLGSHFKEFNSESVLPSLERTTVIVNTLCTFLLSLFVSITMARWWSVRQAYQRFFTTSIDLAASVNTCNTLMIGRFWNRKPDSLDEGDLRKEGKEDLSKFHRDQRAVRDAVELLNRYILLSHNLIYREAAAHLSNPKSIREEIDLERLAADDCKLLLRGDELEALEALPPKANTAQAVSI
jgi:hypothetical protein